MTGEYSFSPVAEADLIDSAVEIHAAYESLIECGVQIAELDAVVGNINFIKDTIQTNGVKWFKENCDPKDDFGRLYGLTGSDKETWMKGCDAAVEGLLGDIWNKIKEWWEKFINWVKGLFKKDTEKEVTVTIEQADNKAKTAAAEIKKTPEKKEKVAKEDVSKKGNGLLKRGWSRFTSACKRIKSRFSKSSTEDINGTVHTISVPGESSKSMLTLEGIKEASRLIPSVVSGLESSISEVTVRAQQLFAKALGAKDKATFESIANEFETSLGDVFEKKMNPLLAKLDEAEGKYDIGSGEDSVTLGQMHIRTIEDAVVAIESIKTIKTSVAKLMNVDKLLSKFTDTMKTEIFKFIDNLSKNNSLNDDQEQELLSIKRETAKKMNSIAVSVASGLGELTEGVDVMCKGFALIAVDISDALTKAAA